MLLLNYYFHQYQPALIFSHYCDRYGSEICYWYESKVGLNFYKYCLTQSLWVLYCIYDRVIGFKVWDLDVLHLIWLNILLHRWFVSKIYLLKILSIFLVKWYGQKVILLLQIPWLNKFFSLSKLSDKVDRYLDA